MPTIRVDDDVFEGLKKLAEPFVDSPSSVIRRLLEEKGLLNKRTAAPVRNVGTTDSRASGTLTPQQIYEQYLLITLDGEFKGRGDKKTVTQSVVERMRGDGLIGPADLELVATGETKAENTIAWGRNALKERGYLSRLSPRGIWELTTEGHAAARQVRLASSKRS